MDDLDWKLLLLHADEARVGLVHVHGLSEADAILL